MGTTALKPLEFPILFKVKGHLVEQSRDVTEDLRKSLADFLSEFEEHWDERLKEELSEILPGKTALQFKHQHSQQEYSYEAGKREFRFSDRYSLIVKGGKESLAALYSDNYDHFLAKIREAFQSVETNLHDYSSFARNVRWFNIRKEGAEGAFYPIVDIQVENPLKDLDRTRSVKKSKNKRRYTLRASTVAARAAAAAADKKEKKGSWWSSLFSFA